MMLYEILAVTLLASFVIATPEARAAEAYDLAMVGKALVIAVVILIAAVATQ